MARRKTKSAAQVQARFLNVDLELESAAPLDALLEAVSEGLFVLHSEAEHGQHRAHLELRGAGYSDAEHVIEEMCGHLERLPAEAVAQWSAATLRCFDAGYDAGRGCASTVQVLSAATAARVGALGATVAVTIYTYGS